MPNPRNFVFEHFLRTAVSKNTIGSYIGIVLLGALGLFFLYFGIAIPFVPLLVLGLIPIGGILLMVYRFKGDLKGEEFWVNLFLNEPQKIVWIKPVNIRHTAAYVLTLYSEMHFQILTNDGYGIMIKCNNAEDQKNFFQGIKQYIPVGSPGTELEFAL